MDYDAFYNIATLDYRKADYQCPYTIKEAFAQLTGDADYPAYYQSMKEIFNLCEVPQNSTDVTNLINSLDEAIVSMAMVDYPYPTNFIANLPAWPVNYACNQAKIATAEH